jgi:hypothetical protein
MKRFLSPLILGATLLTAVPASAQTIGPFRWQLAPYGSVLHLTITPQGNIFLLNGFEAQCGGNLSLPVSGVAVPQADGTVFLGLTSITENGSGLHTRAYVNLSTLNGSWSDNAGNSNQSFVFNPGDTCPGGPRTGPIVPNPSDAQGSMPAELESRAPFTAAEKN